MTWQAYGENLEEKLKDLQWRACARSPRSPWSLPRRDASKQGGQDRVHTLSAAARSVIAAALRGILLAQSGATFTPLRSIPECKQTPQFLIATDRPGNLSSTRLETTRDCSLPPHAPGADRFGNSGECVLLGIFANEGAADEPAGTRSDEDGVGGHQIAYACGNN